ncbi:hypothetical protein M758_6G196100 [Ceratodon purpureus]|nr:hypothetical protein M758_6G196100 [Ceratodon purpureus]
MAASSAMARCALSSRGLMSLDFTTKAASANPSAPRFIATRCSSEAGSGDKKQEMIVSEPSRLEITSAASRNETRLMSVAPILALAALPGAGAITELFTPFGELVRTWDLPQWLIHWGHPGNMAVVLFAMGGYGSYLGWQIRLSPDGTAKAAAKDLHPKLLAGMFFFFAAGATGGVTSLITSGKPIFESPHAVTGLLGLFLLGIQTALSSAFEANPGLRNVHAIFGTSIMALFLVHAVFGLQLGLSY